MTHLAVGHNLLHFGVDEHPFATYDVHQGWVLTHSHLPVPGSCKEGQRSPGLPTGSLARAAIARFPGSEHLHPGTIMMCALPPRSYVLENKDGSVKERQRPLDSEVSRLEGWVSQRTGPNVKVSRCLPGEAWVKPDGSEREPPLRAECGQLLFRGRKRRRPNRRG